MSDRALWNYWKQTTGRAMLAVFAFAAVLLAVLDRAPVLRLVAVTLIPAFHFHFHLELVGAQWLMEPSLTWLNVVPIQKEKLFSLLGRSFVFFAVAEILFAAGSAAFVGSVHSFALVGIALSVFLPYCLAWNLIDSLVLRPRKKENADTIVRFRTLILFAQSILILRNLMDFSVSVLAFQALLTAVGLFAPRAAFQGQPSESERRAKIFADLGKAAEHSVKKTPFLALFGGATLFSQIIIVLMTQAQRDLSLLILIVQVVQTIVLFAILDGVGNPLSYLNLLPVPFQTVVSVITPRLSRAILASVLLLGGVFSLNLLFPNVLDFGDHSFWQAGEILMLNGIYTVGVGFKLRESCGELNTSVAAFFFIVLPTLLLTLWWKQSGAFSAVSSLKWLFGGIGAFFWLRARYKEK